MKYDYRRGNFHKHPYPNTGVPIPIESLYGIHESQVV